MAKLKMKLVGIYALRKDRKAVIERLQRLSVVDISTTALDEETSQCPEGFSRPDTASLASSFKRNADTAEQSLKILDEYAPEKKSLISSFGGRREISPEQFNKSAESSPAMMKLSFGIIAMQRDIAEKNAEIIRLSAGIDQLKVWESLDVPLSFSGTVSTAAFIGTFPVGYTLEALCALLAEKMPDAPVHAEIISSTKEQTCVFLTCLSSDASECEKAIREMGFARPLQNTSRLPSEKIALREKRIEQYKNEITDLKKKLENASEHRREIEETADYYSIRAEKYNALSDTLQTGHTVLIRGYIAEIDIPYLERRLGDLEVVIDTSDANEKIAPVKLKNNAFSRPAESITEMYALPLYTDIDPTPITGFFYYFFFGMMFSDMGYGLIMIAAMLFALKKLHPEPTMAKTFKLFLYCGISTTLWGAVFGSFFGDSLSVISKNFFGTTFSLPALLDPMHGDAVKLLIISLILGFVQVIVGLIAKFVVSWKNGDKKAAFFDAGLWIVVLMGLALLAAGVIYKPLMSVGGIVAIAGAAGLILTQGRESKGVMKLVKGVTSLYDVTSYVSDLLSFSRLMALGLTTSAMSAVFNLLGTLAGGGFIGVILMTVMFIVGHAINFGLNALGAYVHTLRLEYVELFSKFYEGGGRKFNAFSHNGKYTRIKEEK